MPDIRQRLLHILDSAPSDYFDDLKPTEMVFKLMMDILKDMEKTKQLLFQGPINT